MPSEGFLRMKIATFNINNINKWLHNLLAWLEKAKPDVACLQELKSENTAFPAAAIKALGYEAVWQGEPALERRCDSCPKS
jgi:exodeoxyribonuclease-3